MIESGASFLQSWEWGSLQENLGRTVIRLTSEHFTSLLIKKRLLLGKNCLYAPRGPVTKDPIDFNRFQEFLDEARRRAEDANTIFLRAEPNIKNRELAADLLRQAGFSKTKPVQPETSLMLNLNQSEEALLKNMEHDTRYAIRAALRRGVKIIRLKSRSDKAERFNDFWNVFKETQARHSLKYYSQDYYKEVVKLDGQCRSEMYLGTFGNQTICGALVIIFGKNSTYLYSGSRAGFSRYNAPTLLLWEAIASAKKEGGARFDFWGINTERKKWAGLTAFKKSFGGEEFKYAGTWDHPLDKKWYLLYRLASRFAPML